MPIGLVCLKPNARQIVRPATGPKPFVNWGLIGTRDVSGFLNLETTFRQDGPEGILAIRPGLDWQGWQTGRRTVVLQLSPELACPVGMPGQNWRAVLTYSLRLWDTPVPSMVSALLHAVLKGQSTQGQEPRTLQRCRAGLAPPPYGGFEEHN